MYLTMGMAARAYISKATIRSLLAEAKALGATAVDIPLKPDAKARVHFKPVDTTAPTSQSDLDQELEAWEARHGRKD